MVQLRPVGEERPLQEVRHRARQALPESVQQLRRAAVEDAREHRPNRGERQKVHSRQPERVRGHRGDVSILQLRHFAN